VGCSSGDEWAGGSSVPAYTASTEDGASQQASESVASPSVPEEVTAEGLSDSSIDFTVNLIPEDLDDSQKGALVGYLNAEKATRRAFRAMDGDLSGIEATTTGEAWPAYQDQYNEYADSGQHESGSVGVDVLDVKVFDDSTSIVKVCLDQSKSIHLTSTGEDMTTDRTQGRVPVLYSVTLLDGAWKVSAFETGVMGSC